MVLSILLRFLIKKSISKLVKANPSQLTEKEYNYIAKKVIEKKGCNMLVFGVGRDSKLWIRANKKGGTYFLENSVSWLAQIRTENPDISGFIVKYCTIRKNWKELLEQPSVNLKLDLPKQVLNTKWDIIFIDGPAGYNDMTPGRMQSIYTASILSRKNQKVDIFIHDCDREVEKAYSNYFFKNLDLITDFDRLRHYKKNRTRLLAI